MSFIADELGVEAKLAETTDTMNRRYPQIIADNLKDRIRRGATVAVLGLSYKPNSHVTEESQGLEIAYRLSSEGFRVVAFDPMSEQIESAEIRRHIVILNSIHECLSQAEAVLITTPDAAFRDLTSANFRNEWAEVLVIDLWRLLRNELTNKPGIKYVAVGLSEDDNANAERLKKLWWGENGEALHTSAE